MNIRRWLEDMGLGEHAAAFEEQAIEADGLGDLTAEDLKELGVAKLGHRKKILAAIGRLREAEATETGSPEPPAAGPDDTLSGLGAILGPDQAPGLQDDPAKVLVKW